MSWEMLSSAIFLPCTDSTSVTCSLGTLLLVGSVPYMWQIILTYVPADGGSIGSAEYIEEFENKAIKTTENPPRFWKRYIDNTFVI